MLLFLAYIDRYYAVIMSMKNNYNDFMIIVEATAIALSKNIFLIQLYMRHIILRCIKLYIRMYYVHLSAFIICLCTVNVNQCTKDDTKSLFDLYLFI